MAKKTKVPQDSFNFAALAESLSKFNPDSEILTDDSKSIKIENWLSTGNYALNAQISGSMFKGIPEGKVTVLGGPSGCLHPDQEIEVYVSKRSHNKQIKYLR